MESGLSTSSGSTSPGQACPDCGKALTGHAGCADCGRALKADVFASAILSPTREPMDETLTAYLLAPLPEEALRRTSNPANLFGKYVFLREVGRGASGSVIKAWDTYLSRHVALKFLHLTAARNVELNDTERVQDFIREARLAARLQHPNIVQIHEVDCREGRYYISMEFIDGGTLAERIHGPVGARTRTRFYHEPQRFLELLRTIALAVHHAHRQPSPVVHRDLKPQNVLIDARDKPYVADFGLANEIQVGPQIATGGVRGTPAYMAPEQALGRTDEIDPRTDVYSLGVILFEMLTGEVPFGGTNIPSILRKIVQDPPETPSVVIARNLGKSPEVAAFPVATRAALEKICLKALAKSRDDRYGTALEFADALASCAPAARPDPAAAPVRPAASKPRRVLRTSLVGAALLAILLLLVPKLRGASAPAAPAPAEGTGIGDDLALLASGYRDSGRWVELRAAVAELRKKAPNHGRLAEFDDALDARVADLKRRRREWSLMLDRLSRGLDHPEAAELRRRIGEAPEIEEELWSELRAALRRLETALLGEIQEIVPTGPCNAWTSKDLKALATSLRDRVSGVTRLAEDPSSGLDPRALLQGSALLDRVLAYQGTWTLRVNVSPFAEFRIVDGETERARDLTPAFHKDLEIGRGNLRLEMGWPSLQQPKVRWSSALPQLAPGDTLVVSGDLQQPVLAVEAP